MSRTFKDPEYHIFYDMGAGSTVASLVKFEQKEIKEGKYKKKTKITELEVKAVGHDASLGGQSIDRKIQQLLANTFMEGQGKKLGVDIFADSKAMAKLLREANRVKHILSANQDTFAGVGGSALQSVQFGRLSSFLCIRLKDFCRTLTLGRRSRVPNWRKLALRFLNASPDR